MTVHTPHNILIQLGVRPGAYYEPMIHRALSV